MTTEDAREGFRAIAKGWMLIDDLDELTERIERLGEWVSANKPLLAVEQATVTMMIESHAARSIIAGAVILPFSRHS